VISIADPLINYLRQLQAMGVTHVNVDDEARLILREFYKRATSPQAPVGQLAQPKNSEGGQSVQVNQTTPQTTSAVNVSDASVSTVNTLSDIPNVVASGNDPVTKIASLKQLAKTWEPAKSLGDFRDTLVFSSGTPTAEMMLVGGGPGFDDERLQEPFSGKAGQKLSAILKAMGTERAAVYLTNILKLRPKMQNQTTSNRQATAEEIAVWMPFLKEEVHVVTPKVIIAFGVTAAQSLLSSNKSVAELRGVFHQYQGVPLRVTLHPSFILTDELTPEKRMLWEDMLSVMEFLNMPISEKQRGYFLKK